MNIEETDYVEITYILDLKSKRVTSVVENFKATNTHDISVEWTADEIFNKFKDALTKDQIRDLYRDAGSIIELDLNALKGCNNFSDMLKVFRGSPAFIYESDNSINYPNYIGAIDPINSDNTACDISIYNQPRF